MVTYDEIIDALNNNMPYYFKSQAVYDEIFHGDTVQAWDLNINPYSNKGLLPQDYVLRKWDGNQKINPRSKGEEYFVEMLYWINQNNEQHLLPVFFLYAYCKDRYLHEKSRRQHGYLRKLRSIELKEENLCNDIFDLLDLCAKAEAVLKENNYPLADYRYTSILPLYNQDYFDYRNTKIDVHKTADDLAKYIISLFQCIIKTYRLEYWHYSDKEYERVKNIVSSSYQRTTEELMRRAQEYVRNNKKDK